MSLLKQIEKVNMLNQMIRKAISNESTGEVIAMISLTARATSYIRNNAPDKYAKIENEIDDAIRKYKKYSNDFKLTHKQLQIACLAARRAKNKFQISKKK